MAVNMNDVARAVEGVIGAMIDVGANPSLPSNNIAGVSAVGRLGFTTGYIRDEILKIERNLEALVATGRSITQGELIEILKMVGRISTKGDSY